MLTSSSGGLTLSGSVLTMVTGLNGLGQIIGDDLGSVNFTTEGLSGGSLQKGGVFSAGGSLTIATNGTGGLPNGQIFAGTFSGLDNWMLVTLANKTHNYTLSGNLSGALENVPVSGVLVQITVNTGTGFFNGSSMVSSGDISFTTTSGVVPEPGSLGLVGTGLISLAGVVRCKWKA